MTGDEAAGGAIARESLHDWLMSDRPRSRRQASLGRAYGAWRTFARNRLAMLGLLIVIGLVLTAVFADVLSPYSPFIGDLRTTRLLPPSAAHWLGTDDQGRDILSRLIFGSRITLFVVILVAILAAPIGLAVGTVAGYSGGLDRRRADAHHRHLPRVPAAHPGARLRRRAGSRHRERGDRHRDHLLAARMRGSRAPRRSPSGAPTTSPPCS